jgi:hypothetical protein
MRGEDRPNSVDRANACVTSSASPKGLWKGNELLGCDKSEIEPVYGRTVAYAFVFSRGI